jgi:two-component system sensor histidine kinase RpfC
MPAAQSNNIRGAFSLHTLKKLFRSIGWSGSLEQEQSVLRIFISLSFLGYLLIKKPIIEPEVQSWYFGIMFITGFLLYSVLLFTATLRWPHRGIIQRIIGICIDIGVFSYGLHITGPLSAPWYGVYLWVTLGNGFRWVTLGNGFRYGENYLYLSCIASLIGFGTVVATTAYWAANTELAIGLAITLLVIPAYSGVLIRRLNEARQRADAASRAKTPRLTGYWA